MTDIELTMIKALLEDIKGAMLANAFFTAKLNAITLGGDVSDNDIKKEVMEQFASSLKIL